MTDQSDQTKALLAQADETIQANLRRCCIEGAIDHVAEVLAEILPAGPDDEKPPPDWPHWQLCHELQHAKLLLSSALGRLAER